MYIYHNKVTNEYKAYSNPSAISQNEPIKIDRIKYHFFKKKVKEWHYKDEFAIIRTDLVKSKRQEVRKYVKKSPKWDKKQK